MSTPPVEDKIPSLIVKHNSASLINTSIPIMLVPLNTGTLLTVTQNRGLTITVQTGTRVDW